jgi:hypothetical protein
MTGPGSVTAGPLPADGEDARVVVGIGATEFGEQVLQRSAVGVRGDAVEDGDDGGESLGEAV